MMATEHKLKTEGALDQVIDPLLAEYQAEQLAAISDDA